MERQKYSVGLRLTGRVTITTHQSPESIIRDADSVLDMIDLSEFVNNGALEVEDVWEVEGEAAASES